MLNITATLQRSATSYLGLPSVLSVNGESGVVVLDKTDIGLGSVLNLQQEPALGNPGTNGYVLSSTTGGTRSWIEMTGGGGGVFADLDFTGSNITSITTRLFSSLQSIPTTLAGYGITDAQAIDADLTSWAAITRASGFDTFTATPSVSNLKSLLSDETTVVGNLLSLANPSAISFIQIAADNTVSTRTPAQVLSDIGAEVPLTFTLPLLRTVNDISMTDAGADGVTKGVATFTAADFDAASGVVSIDYANGQAAASGVKGFLTAADWATFNSKQAAITFGAGVETALAVATNAAGGFSPIDGTAALTNKTINLSSNTLTGTLAQFNTALSDDNFAGLGAANVFTAAQTISTINSATGTTLNLNGTISAQAASAIAGTIAALTASAAIAGSSNAGAAAGGDVTITSGAAARLTSGNANGGNISLVTGAGIGTGTAGQVLIPSGTAAAPSLAFTADSNTGFYGPGGDELSISNGGVQTHRLFAGIYRMMVSGSTANIQLGGSTSSFPMLKRSTTGVHIRLADDSAFAPLATGALTAGTAGTSILNIRHGISGSMVLGTVTVTDTGCTANTRYFFSAHTLGTVSLAGGYYASTRTASTSFVITSSQATETSTIDWMAIEP